MINLRRISVVGALVVAALSSTVAVAAGGRADSGTAWLGVTHTSGGLLIIAGDVKDKLLGDGAIVYRIKASSGTPGTIKATSKSVTLYTKKGTLFGTGSATETTNADGTATVSAGKISLKTGTGKLKGHSLVGTFSGTYDGSVYVFNYKGTYK